MSAMIKCKTEMRRKDDLVSALRKIVSHDKIEVAKDGEYITHKGYGRATSKVEVRVDRSWHRGYGDLSFVKDGNTFTQVSDDLDDPRLDSACGGKFSDLLKQNYAASAAERSLRAQGFSTKTETGADGKIRIRAFA
jgi:hypothetical protein